MYPFAIINSFGSKIERVYRDFALKVNKVLIPALSELLPSPQSHDVVRQIRVSPSPKGRGAASIRLDASNILELLEEIRLNYGDYVDQEKLEKIISENINLLDGWSTSQLNKMISDQNAVLGVGNGFKPFPTGGVDKPVVPLIPRKNVVSMQNIPLANNSQRLLQNDAYSKYFFDVEEIINNGIIDGLNADEITKQILGKVDMNAKRARFWAEDQASIFQAEQTRLKAIREGQTHYKWIAGASARPSHAVHNGQVYSWNVGVNNLSRPGARHPGEDYRCHCKIGLATPEEIAKAGSPPPRAPQSTTGLIENYSGSEAVKAEKGKAFIESMNSTATPASMGFFEKFFSKKTNTDFQGNKSIEEYWTTQLKEAKAMGLDVPSNVIVLQEEEFLKLGNELNNPENAIATYILKNDTIYINGKYSNVWNEVDEYIKQAYKDKFISTGNKNHIALHELAHKEHFQKGKLVSYNFNQNEKLIISTYVSDYAAADAVNFVAEFRVMLLNDPSLIDKIDKMKSDEPMKLIYNLYKRLGGI